MMLKSVFDLVDMIRSTLVEGNHPSGAAKGFNLAIMVQDVRSRDLIKQRLRDEYRELNVEVSVLEGHPVIPDTILIRGSKLSLIIASGQPPCVANEGEEEI